MTEIKYSPASFLSTGSRPLEQIIYMTSAVFGDDWECTPHNHSFAEVFYVRSGEGIFRSANLEVPLTKGTLVLINPNTPHTEQSTGTAPLTFVIMGIDNLYFHFPESSEPSFNAFHYHKFGETLYPIMELMLSEVKHKLVSSCQICQHYFAAFFLKLLRIVPDSLGLYSASHVPAECAAVKDYIKLHFAEDLTLDALALFSGFNKYYLSRMFSRTYGTAPINYLLERRIVHSEELLKTTSQSVSRISRLVGFSSPNYFSQSFKRYTGMTPLSYRETHFT